jgi:succinate-acetate transporter protein
MKFCRSCQLSPASWRAWPPLGRTVRSTGGWATIAKIFHPQMMVMSLFAVFWLSFGLLQLPTLGLAAAYSATGDAAEGAASKEYNAVVGLYLIVWGFALFTFWIFTLKTNAVFAGIFGFVTMAAWVLAGAYFKVGSGDYETAGKLQKVLPISLVLAKR